MAARGLLVSLESKEEGAAEVAGVEAAGEEAAGEVAPGFVFPWSALVRAAGITMLPTSNPATSIDFWPSLTLLTIIRLMLLEHMNCHSPVLLGAIGLIAP
jgi:hypothetical protein